jgi:hypothetical protein
VNDENAHDLLGLLPPGPVRHQGGESFRLEIVALPDDVSAIIRLRRFLKTLLRGYGFRCQRIEETTLKQPTGGLGEHQG